MKIIIILLFTFFVIGNIAAQKNCILASAQAVYKIWMPGTMPKDENGNPIKAKLNIERSIFFVSNCSNPSLISIRYDTVPIRFSVVKATNDDIENLIDNYGKKIIIIIPKGFYVWKTFIQPLGNLTIPIHPSQISLVYKQFKKEIKLTLKKETELQATPTY